MAFEVYRNAPVIEAALDIRVRGPVELSESVLAKARDTRYPELFQRPTTLQVQFQADPQNGSTSAQALNPQFGFSYRSIDKLDIYQVRPDGFTHNRLAPYTEWDRFVTEAKRLWKLYRTATRPSVIELVGLNYVNDIEVPFGVDFSEYFNTYIEVPKRLPQSLNVFSLTYQVSIPEQAGLLAIAQGYGTPRRPEYGMIRLNIQAFRPTHLPLGEDESDAGIWEMFEQLRKAKTEAFEACITDKVREMIR